MLLDRVNEVARVVDPAEPTTVTQRAFDAERAQTKRFAEVPPAKRIAERLKPPWRGVLVLAHEPEKERSKLLGAKEQIQGATDWLTDEHLTAVLGLAAVRIGADTVSTTKYDAALAHAGRA